MLHKNKILIPIVIFMVLLMIPYINKLPIDEIEYISDQLLIKEFDIIKLEEGKEFIYSIENNSEYEIKNIEISIFIPIDNGSIAVYNKDIIDSKKMISLLPQVVRSQVTIVILKIK